MELIKKENLVLFSIFILFLAAPIVYLQAIIVNEVIIDVADIKSYIGMLLGLIILKDIMHETKYSKKDMVTLLLFLLFLLYNFTCILYYYAEYVGVAKAIKAFFYNYSLFIFLAPVYLVIKLNKVKRISKIFHSLIITLITAYSIHAILQFVYNKYIFFFYRYLFLVSRNGIKFDHIGGRIRASSIMKSPLELGIYNTLASIYFLIRIINASQKKEKGIYTILYTITSVAIFTTLSRTAIMIYMVSTISFLLINFHKWLFKNKRLVLFIVALFLVFVVIVLMFNFKILGPLINPKNLFIRFEIWSKIIDQFNGFQEVLTGFGKVQNGDFGWYHAIIVDNMYLGILLTGGVLGLILFFTLIFFAILKNIIYTNQLLFSNKIYGNAATAFTFGFLCGGFTENLMHYLYLVFIPFILVKILIPMKRKPRYVKFKK